MRRRIKSHTATPEKPEPDPLLVVVQLHDISAVTAAYLPAGSLDWTRFYSVIYQTEAFESEDRIRSEMARAGTLMTWKAILVTGAGARPHRTSTRNQEVRP